LRERLSEALEQVLRLNRGRTHKAQNSRYDPNLQALHDFDSSGLIRNSVLETHYNSRLELVSAARSLFGYLAGMDSTIDAVEFTTVSPSQRAEAIALLVSREPAHEQTGRMATIVTALRQSDDSAATLVAARRGATLMAVAWAQILPGKTALLWPARLAFDANEAIGDRLQSRLDSQLAATGISMAQAVLSDREHSDAARLERLGYTRAADLLYLVSQLGSCEVTAAEFDVDFVQYTPADRKRLASIVERTYIDTLDVPALDGIRDMADVLDGYERTGEFSPDRWFFIRNGGEDVGCLLLNDHPAQQQWELVYMGIVPEARGNGWGRQATRFAQQLAKAAGRERLILAVDATNDPAVSAYTNTGFFEMLRRCVYLKIFAA
jgi:ribosomal protein S18 acetylase RimI-like enzyme